MSEDSDIKAVGKALDEERKHRHEVWHRWNSRKLVRKAHGRFTVTNDGECVMFREKGFPMVDFYPSTGRFRASGVKRTMGGHFDVFWAWYLKQGVA